MPVKPTILFVDDSESDTLLIQLALEQAGFPVSAQFVADGISAMEYLNGEGPYRDRARYPTPHVLVTDLKMPRTTGFELLQRLRAEAKWRGLPVIVFSGSDQVKDRQRALELGADSYVVKEVLMQMRPLVEAIARHTGARTVDSGKPASKGKSKGREVRTRLRQ